MNASTIARLKITLDDVKPAVSRRVEVPFDIRLDRLHLTIQAAMGWTNSHLYEIRADGVGWSTPDPDADWVGDFIDAREARLGDRRYEPSPAGLVRKGLAQNSSHHAPRFFENWRASLKWQSLKAYVATMIDPHRDGIAARFRVIQHAVMDLWSPSGPRSLHAAAAVTLAAFEGIITTILRTPGCRVKESLR